MLIRALASVFLLVLAAANAGAHPSAIAPRVGLQQSEGFCPGTPSSFEWQTGKPANLQMWTSLCGPKQAGMATASTQAFRAPAHLSLYMLGWMTPNQQSMRLENLETGAQLAIRLDEVPGGGWQFLTFAIPDAWGGKSVRLTATTSRSGDLTWVGFSEPLDAGDVRDYRPTLLLTLRIFEYYLLLSLLFFAVVTAGVRRGVQQVSILLFMGLAGLGIAGYAAFWAWFLVPKLGHFFSFVAPVLSAAYLVWEWRRLTWPQRTGIVEVARLWLLVIASSLVVLAAGFLFGGLENPIATAQTRFSHQLPMDNVLQYVFFEQIIGHKVLHPMIGDWLSSDRPPLETGFTLLQLPYVVPPRRLAYTVLGVILQSFWAPALWAFLLELGVRTKFIVCVLAVTLFSGFVLLNSFFVWPKLLAAAYMLGFSMLLLVPRCASELKRPGIASLAGALLALSMLSHGGSAFALVGLVPTLLLLRRKVPPRAIACIACLLLLLYLPWIAYQKRSDPPGDRLLKWHLAGVVAPTSDSFGHVLLNAYSHASWAQIVAARKRNVLTMAGSLTTYWSNMRALWAQLPNDLLRNERHAGEAARILRLLQFFHFLLAPGFLMAGPLFLLAGVRARFRNETWRAAALSLLFCACTLVIWCALLFVPDSAIIVSGTYVANLLAITGSMLAIAAVSSRLAIAVAALQCAFSFIVYVVYGKGAPAPGNLPEGVVHRGELILLVLALLVLIVVLRIASHARWSQSPSAVNARPEPART